MKKFFKIVAIVLAITVILLVAPGISKLRARMKKDKQ